MKRIFFYLAMFFSIIEINSCCVDGKCSNNKLIGQQIHIAYSGFTDLGIDSVNSGAINLAKDSVYLKTYDIASGQLIRSVLISYYNVNLGLEYTTTPDSFYLNKLFYVISRPGETDTINNINYQVNPYGSECQNCLFERPDYIATVVNFTYQYRGQRYTGSDTIYIHR